MKSIVFLYFCVVGSFAFCQASDEMHCNNYSKIFLIGKEQPGKENLAVDISFLRKLNADNIFPKYIILETGHAKAFILNRYLENGEIDLLKDLFILDSVTQNHYVKLRAIHENLSPDRKFSFIGVNYDFDYEATHLALRYLLLNEKEFSENTMCTSGLKYINYDERFNYLICTFIDQRLSDSRAKEDIELMLDILNSKDSSLVIKKMGVKYNEAKMVLDSYLLSKQRKNSFIYYTPGDKEFQKKREDFITNNIYKLFLKDTTAYIFGSFTSCYTLFKEPVPDKVDVFNTFANSLNYNGKYPLTNNKICASIIIHKDLLKQQSKDYGLNKNELVNEYKALEPNKLLVKPYTGKYPMINQILFYNYKPIRK